ncbi:hypothetical protein [Ferrovibrio terrae]|uniref:hypothetical protein n=1 Tax=Ferrovibrio terrae TaxID=2594003 RepID=UPI003137A5B3
MERPVHYDLETMAAQLREKARANAARAIEGARRESDETSAQFVTMQSDLDEILITMHLGLAKWLNEGRPAEQMVSVFGHVAAVFTANVLANFPQQAAHAAFHAQFSRTMRAALRGRDGNGATVSRAEFVPLVGGNG